MKKNLVLLLLLIPLFGYCATYTIKENGKVYNNNGVQTQNAGDYQNVYTNYTPQNYNTTNALNSSKAGAVEIVMDYSGSMADWIKIAKITMANIVSQIPSSVELGFRAFGQNTKEASMGQVQGVVKTVGKNGKVTYKALTGKHLSQSGGCSATTQVAPIVKANSKTLLDGMNSIDLGGATPMVLGLQKAAYSDFSNVSSTNKKIILITDGWENCGGDPCDFAKTLAKNRPEITIDVILVGSNSRKLKCVSNATGGNFYNADNLNSFSSTLIKSIETNAPVNMKDNSKGNGQSYEFIEY